MWTCPLAFVTIRSFTSWMVTRGLKQGGGDLYSHILSYFSPLSFLSPPCVFCYALAAHSGSLRRVLKDLIPFGLLSTPRCCRRLHHPSPHHHLRWPSTGLTSRPPSVDSHSGPSPTRKIL